MRLRDLTPEDLAAYAEFVQTKYNCAVLRKDQATEMQVAAELLDALGYVARDVFMRDYATTLANRIYLPYTPGDASRDLLTQLMVLAHEASHVHQYQTTGLRFAWMYVSDPEDRAVFESEAMRTEIPIQWQYADQAYDTTWASNNLTAYGCSANDIATAKALLDAAAEIVYRGGVTTAVARDTVAWLKDRGILP